MYLPSNSSPLSRVHHNCPNIYISADPNKVRATREWPKSKTTPEACSFHGLVSFYRRFIKHFDSIIASITDCLKKEPLQWTPKVSSALREIIERILSPPVLRHPDFSKVFKVACDAYGYGTKGVLSRSPIAFFSEKLSKRVKCTTFEKELYVLLQSLRHYRYYLLPREFVVYFDHEARKY